jgi:hypothetical protein
MQRHTAVPAGDIADHRVARVTDREDCTDAGFGTDRAAVSPVSKTHRM